MKLDYELKQYEDQLSRWNSRALAYCEKVKAKFVSVLKFPFGGWMIDIKSHDLEDMIDEDLDEESDENNVSEEENDKMNMDDDDEMKKNGKASKTNSKQQKLARLREMEGLRKIYLPNMCFILLDMFSKMNLNKDLIKLSDLIAYEAISLYKLFDNQQLKCFLNKIADASINLLDSNSDYLGY
jgi:hypothetical protein